MSNLLGFIYRITLPDGSFYIGRKQFWSKRGKNWFESDWRTYTSSSNKVNEYLNQGGKCVFEILAVFTSKSLLRYAEAAAIILSKSYEDSGHNWSFAGCRGTLKFEDEDRNQLNHLREILL